jgi:folate-binding protein YgfZ
MNQISGPESAIGGICNLQGRMVTSFRILEIKNGFLLRMNRELVPVTQAFLQKYIVFSKASMTNLNDDYYCYGLVSDGPLNRGENPEVDKVNVQGFLTNTSQKHRYELWSRSPLTAPDSWPELPGETWNFAELNDGIAWVTGNTSKAFIPQMLNYQQLGGISFDKGCYLGQEIVARMEFRGELKRRLARARVSEKQPATDETRPHPGDEIHNDQGKNAGELAAVATDKNETRILAVLKEGQSKYLLASGEPLELLPIPASF